MPTSLLTTEEAVVNISATGADGSPKPAAFAAQVTNYPGAYIAVVGNNQLHFVARAAGDYTVTIGGHSQDGTELPTTTIDFHVAEPPVAQATSLVASDPTVRAQDITTPADPGTNTVTGTV